VYYRFPVAKRTNSCLAKISDSNANFSSQVFGFWQKLFLPVWF